MIRVMERQTDREMEGIRPDGMCVCSEGQIHIETRLDVVRGE